MKNKAVKLSIESTCTENWVNVSATTKGAFCQQCQKEVIDFSKLSDNQIIEYFDNYKVSICGKLKNSQIDRFINSTPTYNFSQPGYYKLFMSLFISTFWGSGALAKSSNFESKKPSAYSSEKQSLNIEISEPSDDGLKKFIKGKVLDKETNEPISFANVFIKDFEIGVSTDLDGSFSLSVPEGIFIDGFSLKISYLGYGSLEIINCTIQGF